MIYLTGDKNEKLLQVELKQLFIFCDDCFNYAENSLQAL